MRSADKQPGFLIIPLVALTCVFSGGVVGAVTNMINGAVSPYYFEKVMYWHFPNIRQASIAQGIFEGLQYGVIFSLIFATGFGIITRGQATYRFAFRHLVTLTAVVLCCWIWVDC